VAYKPAQYPDNVWDGLTPNNSERPRRDTQRAPNGEDWDQITAEVIALQQQFHGPETLVADPAGGATVDAEARTAIAAILDILIAKGLMASA